MTDDAALARGLAARGWRVAFHDGGGLIEVDMHDSAGETWREWGRSIALPDVTVAARGRRPTWRSSGSRSGCRRCGCSRGRAGAARLRAAGAALR